MESARLSKPILFVLSSLFYLVVPHFAVAGNLGDNENLRRVVGSKVSFEIPPMQESLIFNADKKEWVPFPASERMGQMQLMSRQLGHSYARATCPKTFSLYYKIFRKIINSNGLQDFKLFGPGLNFDIHCTSSSYRDPMSPDSKVVAVTNNANIIKLSGELLLAAGSEDEVAFVIAHEITHALFDHLANDYKLLQAKQRSGRIEDYFKELNDQQSKEEPEADNYGVLMTWNSGYDPRAAYHVLRNIFIYELGEEKTNDEYREAKSGHGSLFERRQRLNELLGSIGHVDDSGYLPLVSEDMLEAKAEISSLLRQ